MLVTNEKRGRIQVLTCEGGLTIGLGCEIFDEAWTRAFDLGGDGLVLDLRRLTYVDSAGVGAIVGCAKKGGEIGRVVKVVLAPVSAVRRIFKVTQLERAFEIFEDVDAAVKSFA